MLGSYECPELLWVFEVQLDDKGRLQALDEDGSTTRITMRRETGDAITHGFVQGARVDFEWDDQGRLVGGIVGAGRAKGMRVQRRSD